MKRSAGPGLDDARATPLVKKLLMVPSPGSVCVTNGERADSAASIGGPAFRPVLARQR